MKVAAIGNTNNALFVVARYLRMRGHEVHLYLYNNAYELFHPSADSFSDEYLEYTSVLDWNFSGLYSYDADKIRREFQSYDFIIANGYGLAYLAKANISVDLFIPYGYDLYNLPMYSWSKEFGIKRNIKNLLFSYYQRKAVHHSGKISLDYTNDNFEGIVSGLKFKRQRIQVGSPILFIPEYTPENIERHKHQLKYYSIFEKLREENDLLVFQHCSQHWKNVPYKFHNKGNDKLVKGFARLIREGVNLRMRLVLWEYGYEHAPEDTKQLIAELGIGQYVTWVPAMPRKEVMAAISLCDIGVAEIGESWFAYGTVYEYIAMGKPVIYRREDSLYEKYYEERFPFYDAKDESDVYTHLRNIASDKKSFQKTGQLAREWFIKYGINKPIDIYDGLIRSKKKKTDEQ